MNRQYNRTNQHFRNQMENSETDQIQWNTTPIASRFCMAGEHGNPGQSAAIFFGLSSEIVNGDLLMLNLTGGNGGNGTRGTG